MNRRCSSRTPSLFAPCRARAAIRRVGDAGFTLIELIVTMAIMALVMVIASGLIIGFQQQTQNVGATVNGARQAQIAGTALIQYLRAAIQIAGSPPLQPGSPTPTILNPTAAIANAGPNSLGVVANVGTPSCLSPAPWTSCETPVLTPIYAYYTAGTHSLPTGTGVLQVQFGCGPVYGGCASGVTHVVSTFFVLSPSAQIFTYYMYTSQPYTSPPNTTNVQGSLQAITQTQLALNPTLYLPQIVAIGMDVSFFAGPEAIPTRGYAADIATTLNTIVYLHNTVNYGT